MAVSMCSHWTARGLRPLIVELGFAPAELRESFAELAVPVESLIVKQRGYARYLKLTADLRQLCRRFRPRAVLSMPFGLHSFIAAGARAAGVRRTCAHVGNPPSPDSMSGAQLRKARAIVQIGRPFTHRLICCSNYVERETIKHLGVTSNETRVIYNGVDVEPFARIERHPKAPNAPWIIGMVATLEGHKDQATLVRAAALAVRRGLALEVCLVGDGARRRELAQLIRELDAPVRLLGSRTDVVEQVSQFDIFAFSTTEREGLGIALIEAMAASIPVIASDVPACREVLGDGALGKLVGAGDPVALVEGIVDMTEHWGACQEVAARAKAAVLGRFTATVMAERYLDALGIHAATSAGVNGGSPVRTLI
jgi:glycosyltransferase involved in cell wall biosynthesis